MTVLVTGAAGFIGFHLSYRLLKTGFSLIGFDNFNSYYEPALKRARKYQLDQLSKSVESELLFVEGDLEDRSSLVKIFETHKPTQVVHLAAQAGVRFSLENPAAYIQSNLVGFGHILECCRNHGVENLIYASSSSVYGGNIKMPFAETDGVDHPISLYAATKKANELMAHTYSHLYGLPSIGLRFFTVYGPWGRPDMALFLFTKAILSGEPIKVFNQGQMVRDFTYIDDIVESLMRLMNKPPKPNLDFDRNAPDPSLSWAPYRIFNIGNSRPIKLLEYIDALELSLGMQAKKEFLPIQPGDVIATEADTSALESWIGFKPNTPVQEGVSRFVEWYRKFYKV